MRPASRATIGRLCELGDKGVEMVLRVRLSRLFPSIVNKPVIGGKPYPKELFFQGYGYYLAKESGDGAAAMIVSDL